MDAKYQIWALGCVIVAMANGCAADVDVDIATGPADHFGGKADGISDADLEGATRWVFDEAGSPNAHELQTLVRRIDGEHCVYALRQGDGQTSRGTCATTDYGPLRAFSYHWSFVDSASGYVRAFEMRNVRNGIELAYGNSVQFRMTEDPTADIPEGIYVPDARPGVGQIVSRGGRTCHIGFDAAIHCFGDGPAERMPLRTRNPTDEDGYAMVAMSADQVAFGVTRAAGQICATDRASAVTYGVEDTFLHPGVVGEITQIRSWQTIESVNHITPDATCRIIDGVPWCYFGDFLRIEAVPHVLVDIATGFGLRCGRIWNSGGDLFCWRQEWANDLRHCNSNLEYCPLGARAPAGVDLTRVRSLGVGRTGLCAVMWDGGGLRCASEDYNADRTFQDRPNFRPVGGLPDDLRVYRSNGFTDCVVSNAGEVFCWGSAGRGLFEPAGISGTSRVEEPVQIPGLSDVVDVAVDQNICALRANGSIVCWGRRHMPCDDHYGTRECGEFYTGLEEVVGAWPL